MTHFFPLCGTQWSPLFLHSHDIPNDPVLFFCFFSSGICVLVNGISQTCKYKIIHKSSNWLITGANFISLYLFYLVILNMTPHLQSYTQWPPFSRFYLNDPISLNISFWTFYPIDPTLFILGVGTSLHQIKLIRFGFKWFQIIRLTTKCQKQNIYDNIICFIQGLCTFWQIKFHYFFMTFPWKINGIPWPFLAKERQNFMQMVNVLVLTNII